MIMEKENKLRTNKNNSQILYGWKQENQVIAKLATPTSKNTWDSSRKNQKPPKMPQNPNLH